MMSKGSSTNLKNSVQSIVGNIYEVIDHSNNDRVKYYIALNDNKFIKCNKSITKYYHKDVICDGLEKIIDSYSDSISLEFKVGDGYHNIKMDVYRCDINIDIKLIRNIPDFDKSKLTSSKLSDNTLTKGKITRLTKKILKQINLLSTEFRGYSILANSEDYDRLKSDIINKITNGLDNGIL